MVVHVVMFKFCDEDKSANIAEVTKRLNALVALIAELKKMEVGVNFSASDRAFDLCLYSTFETEEDLQTYAVHPEHLKVVELVKAVTIESKIVDYIL